MVYDHTNPELHEGIQHTVYGTCFKLTEEIQKRIANMPRCCFHLTIKPINGNICVSFRTCLRVLFTATEDYTNGIK
jgi:hypothetical protein